MILQNVRLVLLVAVASLVASCSEQKTEFVRVERTLFWIGDKPYHFLGTNFWYGINLASKGAGGDRERLKRELDDLQSMGVTNLRIVAGSEGPDSEPYRMVPALQTSPGVYNEDVLDGLDYLLAEMGNRNMRAVVCLTNFWNWSGGMGQYIVWSGRADSIPYPPPHPGGDWGRYQEFTAQFYSNPQAVGMLNDHITFIVGRKNNYTQQLYVDDPTIMSWQLCNEPRGINNQDDYRKWIESTSALIKELDKNHLVTTGSEGKTSSPYSGTDPLKDHRFASIDYMTLHVWVQNWGIYNPALPDSSYEPSVFYALQYLDDHDKIARELGKPMVLEEFGISRDANSHDPGSSTTIRDQYYREVFSGVLALSSNPQSPMAGSNFWAWAGEGRPAEPEAIWKAGDNFIGDPPHEAQGWYSVYDKDSTTIAVIREFAAKMNALPGLPGQPPE